MFGSLCYKHIPDQKRKKLDDKSDIMRLVGYHYVGSNRLYSPTTKKIIASGYVVSNETEWWNWNEEVHKPPLIVELEFQQDQQYTNEVDLATEQILVTKAQRSRNPSISLNDYEIITDKLVREEGD